MSIILWVIGSVLVVSLLSFIGVITLSIKDRLLSKILLVLVSLSVGTLFGDALLHLLPEAVEKSGGLTLEISLMVLAGIIVFFIVERFIHMHTTYPKKKIPTPHKYPLIHEPHKHHLGFINVMGDALHNFSDGLVIAASYLISIPVGIATTLAVILHEIPQELADFGVLIYSGFSKRRAISLNFASATTAILGAVVGLIAGASSERFLRLIIPFAAGGFIYIAGANLIPELHKHCHWRSSLWHIITMLIGIVLMVGLLFLE